jgi:tetratricopeptide (TPR) repeat protein
VNRVLSLFAVAALLSGCAVQPQAISRPEDDRNAAAFSTYLSARFAASEHDLPQAALYYGRALTNDPGNPSLLALSFFYSSTSGDFEAAAKYAQQVVAVTPDDRAALYRSHIHAGGLATVTHPGLARIAAGEKPESLIRTPADGAAEALFGIAASLTDGQSADVSILYLRMALYLRPDLGLANLLLADRFETLRKFDEAIAIYHAIPKDSPYFRMAQVQAALNAQRLGRHGEAIADLKKLVAADPKDTESWIALGDTYRASEKYAEAIDAYDQAEKAIPTPGRRDWPMFYARAMAKERLKRLDESELDIEKALKLSPEQPELLNYLGYSWVDRGRRIPEALTMLEKARRLRPYDGYIVDSVGWAYYQLGRYEDAAKTLNAAVLLVPGDPTINDHLGDALWRAGNKISARFQWNHALTFSNNAEDKAAIERKLKNGLNEKPA